MAEAERARIVVNGEERSCPAGATVTDLLGELGHDARLVAVERNGRVLRSTELADTRLANGDRLEIVRFVQGGRGPCILRGLGAASSIGRAADS